MVKNKLGPKFSVITVVYNDRKHIEDTIKSVLEQTYSNFEYIIIDGASTDGTLDVIKKYKNRIDSWVSEPDKGIYDAMNKGIQKSTGDLLYFLNSNDYFYSRDTLKNVAEQDSKHRSPDILYGRQFLKLNDLFKKDGVAPQIRAEKRLPFGYNLYHQATFFNKKVFGEIGVFNTSYILAGDHDFFCRAYINRLKFVYINDIISIFTDGGRGSNQSLVYKENLEITKKYFGKLAFLRYLFYRKVVRNFLILIKKALIFFGLKKLLVKLIKINNRKRVII